MSSSAKVVGVDACPGGWVAIALRGDAPCECAVVMGFHEVLESHPDARVVAVDIPIGLPIAGMRRADLDARLFVGPRRSSVFITPPREVLEAPSYADALSLSRELSGRGVSRQSYGLGRRILEVDEVAATDDRVFEAHPEVSFAAMAGGPLRHPKKSWNGHVVRVALLRAQGIALPGEIEHGARAAADDVLDAAAAAWTAGRILAGAVRTLPDPPEPGDGGRPVAIWY